MKYHGSRTPNSFGKTFSKYQPTPVQKKISNNSIESTVNKLLFSAGTKRVPRLAPSCTAWGMHEFASLHHVFTYDLDECVHWASTHLEIGEDVDPDG